MGAQSPKAGAAEICVVHTTASKLSVMRRALKRYARLLHVALGIASIAHIAYRYALGAVGGESDDALFLPLLSLHALLHATSFSFHLPRKRHETSPPPRPSGSLVALR